MGFNQLNLSEETRKVFELVTSFVAYCYNRLVMGHGVGERNGGVPAPHEREDGWCFVAMCDCYGRWHLRAWQRIRFVWRLVAHPRSKGAARSAAPARVGRLSSQKQRKHTHTNEASGKPQNTAVSTRHWLPPRNMCFPPSRQCGPICGVLIAPAVIRTLIL